MPEMPDLENFRANLFPMITDKTLTGTDIFRPGNVSADKPAMDAAIAGRRLAAIDRDGKELVFRFEGGGVVSVHLMLNGTISVMRSAAEIDGLTNKVFAFNFAREAVVFADYTGLCNVKLNPRYKSSPDALSPELTAEAFARLIRTRAHGKIKAFLLDQNIIKGIGNAYVDEILWEARISPNSSPTKIPDEALDRLYRSMRDVLTDAIAQINEIAPGIISGEERSFLRVHNKKRKTSPTGAQIIVEQIDRKITYYTVEQILYV